MSMDPDATLASMREAISESKRLHEEADVLQDEANDSGHPNDEDEVRAAGYQQDSVAAEHAADLDEWLSKAGFLPTAWQRQPAPITPDERGEVFSNSEAYAAERMPQLRALGAVLTRVELEIVHDALMAAFQAGYLNRAEGLSVDTLIARMA
jgi:hypothetical protein